MRFGPSSKQNSSSHPPPPPPPPSAPTTSTSFAPQPLLSISKIPTPPATPSSSIINNDSKQSRKRKRLTTTNGKTNQNKKRKLVLHSTRGDGNCLFRSVSFQIYGDESWHDRVREECMEYISKDEEHFSSFVAGSFQDYIKLKKQNGCYGDNPEIQAMAELYNRPVIVYTTDDLGLEEGEEEEDDTGDNYIYVDSFPKKMKKMNIFHNKYENEEAPIRLCYRGKCHYDAVIDPNNATVGLGLGLAGFEPGKADRDLLKTATWATDVEETEKELERIALAASLEDAFHMNKKPSKSSLLNSGKKRRKLSSSPPRLSPPIASLTEEFSITNQTSSSSSSSSSSNQNQHPPILPSELSSSSSDVSPAVRELLLNGFSLEQVQLARTIVGDSFDDMLALLMTSI